MIHVSAKDYYTEFKENSQAAVAKYENVTVEVTGHCLGFFPMPDDQNNSRFGVTISGDGSKVDTGTFFLCCLEGNDPWKQVAPGNEVTIRGVIPRPGVFRRTRRNLVGAKVVSPNPGQKATPVRGDSLAPSELWESGREGHRNRLSW